jgi:hypothetical protein
VERSEENVALRCVVLRGEAARCAAARRAVERSLRCVAERCAAARRDAMRGAEIVALRRGARRSIALRSIAPRSKDNVKHRSRRIFHSGNDHLDRRFLAGTFQHQ